MISCKSLRNGMSFPLQDYGRQANPNLHGLWAQAGFKPVGQSRALRNIEKFVDKVSRSNEPAFIIDHPASPVMGVQVTAIGSHLLQVLPVLGLFDSYHDYAEKPYAFLDACWLIEGMFGIDLAQVWSNHLVDLSVYADGLNTLVEKIRMSVRQEWYLRAPSDRIYESSLRARKIQRYVAGLLEASSRSMLVRLDFGYSRQARRSLCHDRLFSDLRQFLYLKEWHPLFAHLEGYIWSIEEGRRKGPHVHLLLVFSGSKLRQDIRMGEFLCDLWNDRITGGDGISWNCNSLKDDYAEVGIGMVERWDRPACQRAVFFATYLAKNPHDPEEDDPQYLRMKPAGLDTFGTGEQRQGNQRLGRPPEHPIPWTRAEMMQDRWPRRDQAL